MKSFNLLYYGYSCGNMKYENVKLRNWKILFLKTEDLKISFETSEKLISSVGND